jgi:hypothetical protein
MPPCAAPEWLLITSMLCRVSATSVVISWQLSVDSHPFLGSRSLKSGTPWRSNGGFLGVVPLVLTVIAARRAAAVRRPLGKSLRVCDLEKEDTTRCLKWGAGMTNPGGSRLIRTQQVVRVFAATAFWPTCVIRNVRTLIVRSPAQTVSTATVTNPSHTIPASIGVEKPYAIKIASVTPRCPERANIRSTWRRSRLRRGAAVFLPRVPFELWAIEH